GTGLALAGIAALPVDVAGLAGTLADAGFLFRAAQPEAVMFEETHRHLHRPVRWPAQDVGAGDQVGQLLAHRFAHFLVVPQPVARAAREQVVPAVILRQPGRRFAFLRTHAGPCLPAIPATAGW